MHVQLYNDKIWCILIGEHNLMDVIESLELFVHNLAWCVTWLWSDIRDIGLRRQSVPCGGHVCSLATDTGAHHGVLVHGQNDAVVVVDVEDGQRPHPVGDTTRRRHVTDDTYHVHKTLNRRVVGLFHVL